MIKTVGSVCSGIEAASVAWIPLGLEFKWFSEIAMFPSRVLEIKYPKIENVGDMSCIPELLIDKKIEAPDLICGGTPCQAFSLAGWQNGLNDDRGNLTLDFVDIINANDKVRQETDKEETIVFWENVEGVLTDKTNAFGCMISSLAGLKNAIIMKKWPTAGLLRGPLRNVAWRVMDAKYFGLPQQRKRLYLVAGGKAFKPEEVLFEAHYIDFPEYPSSPLSFSKDGHRFEVFREYTDCLYASYGTKWNGNAAATNGSLFIVQDGRIRRVSPLECERLMGFPDNYTDIPYARRTSRYQAIGNSWAVPVITWIGKRLLNNANLHEVSKEMFSGTAIYKEDSEFELYDFGGGLIRFKDGETMNCSIIPEEYSFGKMKDIVSKDAPEEIYISPVGCHGILRRKEERKISINPRLATVLESISSEMDEEEIEKLSRRQRRGRYSTAQEQEVKVMSYGFENLRINANVRTGTIFQVPKMDDYYLGVVFRYTRATWNGCVPLHAKYEGISIPLTVPDVEAWVLKCYEDLDPAQNTQWQTAQRLFWEQKQAYDTQAVFEALNGSDKTTKWLCRKCGPVPQVNPQAGARIRALRMFGYYIATCKRMCPTCGKNTDFDLLVRLPRNPAENQKRFTISKSLEQRIKEVLPLKDACFETPQRPSELIIDHKFPSSRWVNGETVNETTMPDDEIRKKFQLLTNQTNLQKERYCQRCVLKNKRGDFFGITWYYQGDENWAGTSKADENGCVGCPWYDLELWKEKFNEHLKKL